LLIREYRFVLGDLFDLPVKTLDGIRRIDQSSDLCRILEEGRDLRQLNGKVERSHRTDQEEFYQLLTYTDDVDLNKKLAEWERFYNLDRPHGAF